MFYIYEWFNEETGYIFYVGKGTRNRKNDISRRNKLFKEYISKNKCSNRIIECFDNEKDAFELEHKRICYLKSLNQCHCNLDNGGKGGCHFVWAKEMREYYSKYNCMKSKNQRERMSNSNPMKNKQIAKIVGEKHRKRIIIGEKLYSSFTEAAFCYKVSIQCINYWIKIGKNPNTNEVCYYYGKLPNKKVYKGKTWCKKVICNNQLFNSIKELSNVINVPCSTICKYLKINKPLLNKYYIQYANQQPSINLND